MMHDDRLISCFAESLYLHRNTEHYHILQQDAPSPEEDIIDHDNFWITKVCLSVCVICRTSNFSKYATCFHSFWLLLHFNNLTTS